MCGEKALYMLLFTRKYWDKLAKATTEAATRGVL